MALVSDMLREEGLSAEMTSTQNFQSFISALNGNRFDLILADYSLPLAMASRPCTPSGKKIPTLPSS